jgi:signal transduction histidine kinase
VIWRAAAVVAYALIAAATVAIVRAEPDFTLAGSAAWRAAELGAGALLLLAALGAHAWRPRPAYARPLVAAALLWPVAEWSSPGAGTGFTAGLVLAAAWAPALAHGALRGPDERAPGRAGTAVLALGYVATAGVLGLGAATTFDPAAQGCLDCPRNVLLIHGDADAWQAIERTGLALTAVWALLFVLAAAVALARSGPARRLLAAPVLVPAATAAGLLGAQAVHGLDRGFLSNDPTDRALWKAVIVAVALTAAGVAWERVRAWRTRQAVARIVVALGDSPPPGGLEAQLAATLGDPSLRLLHARDDHDGWVDAAGRAAALPDGDGREATFVVASDRPVAALVHRRGLLADPGEAEEVAGAARLALEHERLGALRRAHLEQLRASRARIVATADAERLALERDLHDGAQQRLVTLAIGMRLARRGAAADDPELAAALEAAEEELRTALGELRELAHGLFPAVLADEGLAAAVEVLAEQDARLISGALPPGRFDPPVEAAAYFVIAEALRRAAPGALRVAAGARDGLLVLDVEAEAALSGPSAPLEDRVGALGGSITAGAGALHVELPCAS